MLNGRSIAYVDIFKVEMDIGDARLGRKLPRSASSRDIGLFDELVLQNLVLQNGPVCNEPIISDAHESEVCK